MDRTASFVAANLLGTVFGILACAPFAAAWVWFWPVPRLDRMVPWSLVPWSLAFLAVLAVTMALHELIHGAVAAWRSGRGFSVVSFGVRKLTPYFHCSVPLFARDYRLSLLAPGVVLGALPSMIAVTTGSLFALTIGLANLAGMGGDLLVLWLLRGVPSSQRVQDHPTLIGCTLVVEPAPGPDQTL